MNDAITSGTIYEAEVKSSNPLTGVITVNIILPKRAGVKCVWAASIFSAFFGFQTKYVPPIGTRVIVLYSSPEKSFIIGAFPRNTEKNPNAFTRTLTGMNEFKGFEDDVTDAFRDGTDGGASSSVANDMLPGEISIENAQQVGIALLNNLAKLSAGDRAKVECFIKEDMVRIISDKFKHFTSFGVKEIYNDNGKLNVQWDGASYEHETFGVTAKDDVKLPHKTAEGNVVGIDFSNPDAIKKLGRWRFSEFVGHIGDMINSYVTDPITSLAKIAEEGRSGKSRFARLSDGTVLLQSVNEIVIERVCRIPVPMQIGEYDDPATKEKEEQILDYLKNWEYSDNTEEGVFESAFNLREYSKWLSGLHSLARFHQAKHNWRINSEKKTAKPDLNNLESDRSSANSDAQVIHIDTYATIRIMRDGSIMMVDGYGSSVLLGNGNIQLAAKKHLFLEAAGDVNVVAGNRMHFKSKDGIEFDTPETIKMRGKGGVDTYADAGQISLQASDDIHVVSGSNVLIEAVEAFIVNNVQDIYFKCKNKFSVTNKMIMDIVASKLYVPKIAGNTISAINLAGTKVSSAVTIPLGLATHPNHVAIGAAPGLAPNKPLVKLIQSSSIIKNSAADISKSLDSLTGTALTAGPMAAVTDVMSKAATTIPGVEALTSMTGSMSNLGALGDVAAMASMTTALPLMASVAVPTLASGVALSSLTNVDIQNLAPTDKLKVNNYLDALKTAAGSAAGLTGAATLATNPLSAASALTGAAGPIPTALKNIPNPADAVAGFIGKSPADMLKLGASMSGLSAATSLADVQNLASSFGDVAKLVPAGDFGNLMKGLPAVAGIASLAPAPVKGLLKALQVKVPAMLGKSSSSESMYQSFTQQLLNSTEADTKTEEWDWSKNELKIGKGGFPWPGKGTKHKAANPGGSKEDIVLTEPLEKDYKELDNKAEKLKKIDIKFRSLSNK